MRTVKQLINTEKKTYILTTKRAVCLRFLADAEFEGITFSDGSFPSFHSPSDLFALMPDGTICYVGSAGRICFHCDKSIVRVDYEKYIRQDEDYIAK